MNQPVFRPAYAGIGSRETPHDVLKLMHDLAVKLAAGGYILRSGGAPGADQAFLSGAIDAHRERHSVETYLPWPSFEREALANITLHEKTHVAAKDPAEWAFPIAARHHPRWLALKPAAQRLHARNVHQILGYAPRMPHQFDVSKFVICWTKDGGMTGGTGQALRIASANKVEIRNLFDAATRAKAEAWLAA